MKEIKTEINISASPEKVWEVLTSFSDWKSWNPVFIDVQGQPNLNSTLHVSMKGKSGGAGQKYTAKISESRAPNFIKWRAKMGAEFLFVNDKVFELEKISQGTKVIHKEMFSGLLAGLFWKKMETFVPPMLNSMNQALKSKVEGQKA